MKLIGCENCTKKDKRYAMLNKVVQNISCSIFNDKESKRYIQKLLKEEMKILVSKDVDNDFDLHKISDIETINSIKIKAYLIILLEDPNFSTDNPPSHAVTSHRLDDGCGIRKQRKPQDTKE